MSDPLQILIQYLSVQALAAAGSEKTPQEPASEPLASLGLASREFRKMFFLIPLPQAPVRMDFKLTQLLKNHIPQPAVPVQKQ